MPEKVKVHVLIPSTCGYSATIIRVTLIGKGILGKLLITFAKKSLKIFK